LSIHARALGVLIVVGALLRAAPAHADVQTELEKARAAYQAHAYDEVISHVSPLLDPKSQEAIDASQKSRARMYLGAAYFSQKRVEEATSIWAKLLVEDSDFQPDPLLFPTDVLNTFIDTKTKVREEINAHKAYVARLEAEKRQREELLRQHQIERTHIIEQMAAEERVTTVSRRLVATVPFGAGQFQNGQSALGWAFLTSETALAIGTAITVPMYSYARSHAVDESVNGSQARALAYQDRANTILTVNLSLASALGVVMIAGIAQAHIAFVPETHETKIRAIPEVPQSRATPPSQSPSVAIAPIISGTPRTESTPGSGFFGVAGTF
jgi:hypothetical protein